MEKGLSLKQKRPNKKSSVRSLEGNIVPLIVKRSLEGNIVPLIVKRSLEGNIVPLIVKPSLEGNIVPLIVKPRKFTGIDRRDLESRPTTKYP